MRTLLIALTVVSGITATARATDSDATAFSKRGPLDKHAEYVRQVLDTLELSDDQQRQLDKIIADGHASWRAWFKENYQKVDAHVAAVRAAKADGDRKRLAGVRKEKKAFMHTAPSLLRHPEPVRAVLTSKQRKLFDERLLRLQRDLHRPAELRSNKATSKRPKPHSER